VTKPKLQFVKDRLLEIDPSVQGTEDTESYKAALILLSALVCGPNAKQLERFTGLPGDLIRQVRHRMIEAQLWTAVGICCDDWFIGDAFCDTQFWADVLVAEGLVVREWIEDEGCYCYYAMEFAPRRAKPDPLVS